MKSERLTLTVPEAAELLGIGRGTAYEGVRTGDIPSVRICRRVLVPRHALLSLLNADDRATNAVDGKMPEAPGHAES